MIESIGQKLTSLCEGILPFYLSEADAKGYPYAVYRQDVQTFRTKDGVYKFTAESRIRVFSKDADEALAKAEAIKAALDANTDPAFVIRQVQETKDCLEDVWRIDVVYFVKQTS